MGLNHARIAVSAFNPPSCPIGQDQRKDAQNGILATARAILALIKTPNFTRSKPTTHETPKNTFSKLDGRVSKKLLAIAASDGFLDFGEDDAKLLDDTRKAMYAELQEALGPFGKVEREMESYGESAEVIFDGQRIGSVVPNTTQGTMDYLSSGGQSVRLTSPATAKRLILSLI
jgi:hypothetical protein